MQHSTDMQEAEGNRFYPEIKTEGKIAIPIAAITQLSIYTALVLAEFEREIPWSVTAGQGYCVGVVKVKHLTTFLVSRKG